jgi:hypothetical protein
LEVLMYASHLFPSLLRILCIMAAILPAMAQVPQLLEYDGFLSGNITGNRTIGVRLYNASKNGTLLYNETIGTVKVTSGEFYFQYGQNGTLGNGTAPTSISAVLTGSQNWLAVTVNGTEQTPRAPLLSVPFALRSADSQKTDADLRKVVDAVGKVVVAFGGNASNLLSNPSGTIATMESTAKNVLEMQKRFRVIGLSGNLSFGNSSTSRSFMISNTGFDRLTVSGISYPAGFSGNWSGVVPIGGSQAVTVTFRPTAVQSYSGNITVVSDATSGGNVLPVRGTGSRLIAVSGNLSFGNVTVNTTATRTFTISNTGTMNLTVSEIASPSRFSGNWSGTIPPGGSQSVSAIFIPTTVQAYGGDLSVVSNASAGRSGLLAVSGVGVAPWGRGIMIKVTGGTLPQSSELAGQTVATFQIGKYEVTWDEWQEVRTWAVANGYSDLASVGEGSTGRHPVHTVNWYDVLKWSNARSEKEGLVPVYQVSGAVYKTGQSVPTLKSNANGYRLPLEKEWEWAARGGVSSQGYTYSGSNDLNAVAWYYSNSSYETKAVGTKSANELGIHDMSGNVWEWCEDSVSSDRRFRGGSWLNGAVYCSVADRDYGYGPDNRVNSIGLRLARSSGN